MKLFALVLSVATLSLIQADVSHLQRDHQQRGGHFIANNGQVVRQSFNSNGDATFSSRTYNGVGNVDINPVHNLRQNYYSAAGCNGCMTRALNINHNTQHNTQQQQQSAYATNPFTNVRRKPQSFNRNPSAPVSGSPQEVNEFFRQQQSSSCSDQNSACVAPKFCFNGFIDQLDAHKAVRSSSGRCYAPEVCCKFAQKRVAQYAQDNSVAAAESTSEILTKEGYVVRKPANQYLPSLPEYKPQPSNDQQTIIRPSTYAPPRPSQPPRTQPPRFVPSPTPVRPVPQRPQYQPQPSEIRPVQYDPAPIVVPVGCSAAMNCTNIQYCDATGVISKTPVTLSPQQEMFRVPLTDCREPNTKQIGKCCRDPDYVDPWPVGRTGQYVPEEINGAFNSGAYKPEPSLNVPVRVKVEQEGYVLPQPSNTQPRLYLPPQNSNRI